MNFKKIGIVVIVVVVLVGGYYGISPLFRTLKVDEPLPVARSGQPISVTENLQKDEVIGTAGHPASGTVRVVEVDGKKYLRYENFKTINGPDLYIYLAKDLTAKEYVSLGEVKATEGSVNYEIPEGTRLAEYPYAMVWCQQFGVLFNSAKISQ